MIKYGLRNNIPSNTLYNSQVGSLVFVCGIVFKVSSLPGIVSQQMQSSTIWMYLMMTVLELFTLSVIYIFMRNNGNDYLLDKNSKAYKLTMLFTMIYLSLKGVFYFAYTAIYLTMEMFLGVAPFIIVVIFLIPIVYLGIKGARTISRAAELLCPLLFVAIVLNFVFLKTNLDVGRNLPVFAMEPSEFFSSGLIFGLWVGDMIPLVFVKVQNKKAPYIGISSFVVFLIINIVAFLGVSMYGNALPFVSNMLVRLSGFSQLTMEIGRMDWTSLFAILTMAIFSLSFLYWGTTACSENLFKSKKPMQFIFPLLLLITALVAPSLQSIADFVLTDFGYFMMAFALLLPLILLSILAINKRKNKEKLLFKTPKSKKEKTPPNTNPLPQNSALLNTQQINLLSPPIKALALYDKKRPSDSSEIQKDK